VVYGRNFRTKSAGQHEWIVVTYLWDGEPLTVKLCLARNERSTHFASSIHVQALEV
jgi:hypothetical protein